MMHPGYELLIYDFVISDFKFLFCFELHLISLPFDQFKPAFINIVDPGF